MSPRGLAVLRAVAATLVDGLPPSPAADLAERVADRIAALPRAADRAELDRLLRLFESRLANLVLAGIARPFTRMSPAQRERYLGGWAASRLALRRKAFQALKRLTTVAHYTTPGVARAIGYPGPLGPPPPLPPPRPFVPWRSPPTRRSPATSWSWARGRGAASSRPSSPRGGRT